MKAKEVFTREQYINEMVRLIRAYARQFGMTPLEALEEITPLLKAELQKGEV